MAIVKLRAFRALAAAIAAGVPDLAGKITVVQAPAGKIQTYPTLVIHPVRSRLEFYQATEVFEPSADRVVMNLGRHNVTVQLQIAAGTLGERFALEAALSGFFSGDETDDAGARPGVLLTDVLDMEQLGPWRAAWEIDEEEWVEDKAGDGIYGSVTALTGLVPILVTRTGAYRIDQLVLGLTEDFGTSFDEATILDSPLVEAVEIDEDGAITPA